MKQYILDNGIRVLVVPLKGLKSVTIEVFAKIGSKYEKPDEFGMSHFLEHMAFKGTVKRPTARSIVNEIDSKGAAYNAGTSHEYTSYYIKTVKENVPWALEMLSDILFNSKFEEKEVEKEKGVITEEIRMYKDNPMMGLSGEYIKFLYGGSKIGCWNISGDEKNISVINRDNLMHFRSNYLIPKDMLVVVAGDVDLNSNRLVELYFSSYSNRFGKALPSVGILLNKSKSYKRQQESEQGHFCLGVPTISWKDERRYALKLLEIIIGGYSSSRLEQRIREDEGLAYYVHSISDKFEEGGYMAFQAGVKMEALDSAIQMAIDEITLKQEPITENELSRAKDYVTGRIKLLMDQSDFWSDFLGQRALLEGKLIMPEEELDRYQAVKIKDLSDLAQEFLVQKNIRLISVSGSKKRV